MTNREYLDYLKVTGLSIGELKYEIDLRFSKIDIDILNYIKYHKVKIKNICENLRNKGVDIEKVLYFIGLLMIHINDEDDFRYFLENILKPRIKREYDLISYIDKMLINLNTNFYYNLNDVIELLK